MSHKKSKLLAMLLSVSLVFQSAAITADAKTPDTSAGDVSIVATDETVSEIPDAPPEKTGESTEESSEEQKPEASSAEEPSETVPSVSENSVSENSVSENSVSENSAEAVSDGDIISQIPSTMESPLFPGLPSDYLLSDKQMEDKQILSEYTEDVAPYEEKDNTEFYVAGQVIYLTDSEEDALTVAQAFGGELESYGLGVAVIRLPEKATVAKAVMAAADEDVLLPAVWPNYYRELYGTYNDPFLKETNSSYQWQHAYVDDSWAWDAGYQGQGVKVGIIDSGTLKSHEEFSGRIAKQVSITKSGSPANATTDPVGHGTHVAGIVAANANNSKGGAGIAPKASLYVYGITSDGSIDVAVEIRAINQAIADGVDIINMSLGGPLYSGAESEAVQNAYKKGIAVFAAAGNEATNAKAYPASYKNVCSIASLQEGNKKSSFTNYNDAVDLAFPGTDIYSTYKNNTGSYVSMSGTSMACPVASGVAAVILSGADDLASLKGKTGTKKVDALISIMKSNAVKASSSGTGKGCTSLSKVFKITTQKQTDTPAAPVFSIANKTTIAQQTTTLTISQSGSMANVAIYYSTNGKTPTFKNGTVTNGTLYSKAITIGGAKNVTVKAIAVNTVTGKSSKAATATYTFAPAPSKVSVTAPGNVTVLSPGNSIALKANVTPSYAVSTKVSWTVDDAAKAKGITVNSSGKLSVPKSVKDINSAVKYTVTATAVDSKGKALANAPKGTYTFSLQAPVIKSVALSQKNLTLTLGTDKTYDLKTKLKITPVDADNKSDLTGKLVWSSSNPDVATAAAGVITVKAAGKADITAATNDGSNKKVVCKLTVKPAVTMTVPTAAQTLALGKSLTLKATVTPASESKKVVWKIFRGTTEVTKGVTVKNGKVTAAKNAETGSYTVKASLGNSSYSIPLTVVKDPIKSITVKSKTLTLFATAGNSKAPTRGSMNAVITGGNTAAVTYTSSAPNIATVDNKGNITAVSCGKAVITCAATDGSNKKATCTVTVTVPMSRLTIVTPDDNDGMVSVGSTIKLGTQSGNGFGTPANTKVKWSVKAGDEKKISVNASGVVKALSLGTASGISTTATVIAEAADGSGVKDELTLNIVQKVTSVRLVYDGQNDCFAPVFKLSDNSEYYMRSGYITTISAPGGKHIGVHKSESGFKLIIDQPTTNKTSAQLGYFALTSDGVKVKVTVKLPFCNKSVSESILLVRSKDGKIKYYK